MVFLASFCFLYHYFDVMMQSSSLKMNASFNVEFMMQKFSICMDMFLIKIYKMVFLYKNKKKKKLECLKNELRVLYLTDKFP